LGLKTLTELREKKQLSLSKLAINLNKNYEKDYRICQIWDWEHDYRVPSEKDTKILADYFQVPKKTFNS
jgi:transcriptional regulator with XRE-family HTH domain